MKEMKELTKQMVLDETAKQLVTIRSEMREEAGRALETQLVIIRSDMKEEVARFVNKQWTAMWVSVNSEVARKVDVAVKAMGKQQDERIKDGQKQWKWAHERAKGEIKRLGLRLDMVLASQREVCLRLLPFLCYLLSAFYYLSAVCLLLSF
jgi:hypothetical protein